MDNASGPEDPVPSVQSLSPVQREPTPNGPGSSASNVLNGVQLVLTFVLGVFGNKIAEAFSIDASILLGFTIVLLAATVLVAAIAARPATRRWSWVPRPACIAAAIGSSARSAEVLPFALALGMLLQVAAILVASKGDIAPIAQISAHSYEVAAGFVVVLTMLTFRALRHERSLMFAYSFGTATGLATTALVLRPYENAPIPTYAGWIVVVVGLGLAISSQRLRNYVARNVAKLRSDRQT